MSLLVPMGWCTDVFAADDAQQAAAAAIASETLKMFDMHGSGDHDGVLELPDINPDVLTVKVRAGTPEADLLWSSYQSVCKALDMDCTPDSDRPDAISWTAFRDELFSRGRLVAEYVANQPGFVLGDSLTAGYEAGAVRTPDRLPTLTSFVLTALGYQSIDIGNIGLVRPYPHDPETFARQSGSLEACDYIRLAISQAMALFAVEGHYHNPQGRVTIAGLGATTLHEMLRDQASLDAENWRSPAERARRAVEEIVLGKRSYLQFGLSVLESKLHGPGTRRGGFFAVALGSNDLLTFDHIVVAAPRFEADRFRADLQRLDEATSKLSTSGVRRVYLVAPDVTVLFQDIPTGASYSNGDPIPSGSKTLYHWATAVPARSIPRHVVLDESQLERLRVAYGRMRTDIWEVLGFESNWLIVDNQKEFPQAVGSLLRDGFSVETERSYGKLSYQGVEQLLSADNEHPSNFFYLLWGQLIVQSLVNAGYQIPVPSSPQPSTNDDIPSDTHSGSLAKCATDRCLARVVDQAKEWVRENPDAYRPRRIPRAELTILERVVSSCRQEEKLDCINKCMKSYWTFLFDDTLDAIERTVGLSAASGSFDHETRVGRIRRELNRQPARISNKKLADILANWIDEQRDDTGKKDRFMRAFYDSFGHQQGLVAEDGYSPGFLRPWPSFALASSATIANDLPSLVSARLTADLEFPGPLAFIPIPLLGSDYTRLGGLAGLDFTVSDHGRERILEPHLALPLPLLGLSRFYWDRNESLEFVYFLAWAPRVSLPQDRDSDVHLARGRLGLELSVSPWADPAFQKRGLFLFLDGRAHGTAGDGRWWSLEGGGGLGYWFL